MIGTFAYLDAGTGSMILQAVIGAGVAVLVVIKGFGRRIMNFFRRLFKRSQSDQPDNKIQSNPK